MDSCHFCLSAADDEARYGRFFKTTDPDTKKPLNAHYFCLLFACNLTQEEDESIGFMGFSFKEIKKEIRRGGKLTCKVCKKKGATTACIMTTCKETYHFPCGAKYGANFRFLDKFP